VNVAAPDALITALAESKLAILEAFQAARAQWRLERAMLLDHIDELTRENEMLNPDRYTFARHRREQRLDEMQRRHEDAA
jgi:hypothetical protein